MALAGCSVGRVSPAAEQNCVAAREVRTLTSTGVVTSVAISADGRYVAWINGGGDQRDSSVWLKSRGGSGPVEFLPAERELEYRNVTLAPDGSRVYFTRAVGGGAPALYAISGAGGEAVNVARAVHSPIAVSPDGRSIAFIRASDTSASLITANSDGTGERLLATAAGRQGFAPRRPAWSPDGKRIGCLSFMPPGILMANVSDGVVLRLGGQKWAWGSGLAWLNPTTLVASATAEGTNGMQLWCVDASSGKARALTQGLMNYSDVGVTRDGTTLVAVREVQSGDLWRIPITGGAAVQITTNPIEGAVDGYSGVSVFPNGDVLFGLLNGTGMAVLRNEGRQEIMIPPPGEAYGWPAVSRDGRTVAYVVRTTDNISRIRLADRDGSHIRSVPGLPDATTFPQFSADNGSLIYTQDGAGVWTIPLTGGTPTRIAEHVSHCAVSSDGQQLACFVRGGVGILPVTGGSPTKIFPAAGAEPPIRWTMDGKSIVVKGSLDGRNVVSIQPLDGTSRREITAFPQGLIYSFDVTPDGQSIIVSYGLHSTDAIERSTR
jgi:Tol biopolymer transport system component